MLPAGVLLVATSAAIGDLAGLRSAPCMNVHKLSTAWRFAVFVILRAVLAGSMLLLAISVAVNTACFLQANLSLQDKCSIKQARRAAIRSSPWGFASQESVHRSISAFAMLSQQPVQPALQSPGKLA